MEDGKPNGYVGFAMASSTKELFWAIDEFVDPYAVEIQTAKNAGYCFKLNHNKDDVESSDYEISINQPFDYDGNWRKPIWVTDISFCSLMM
jgi:hypothetical protein